MATTRKTTKKRVAKRPAVKAKKTRKAKVAPKVVAERRRLIREERALEHDDRADNQESQLSASPEYIEDALTDSLAGELGQAAVESETSGDHAAENLRNEAVDEEEGGPFVVTSGNQEFAKGVDASNPEDAEPADFPTANARRR